MCKNENLRTNDGIISYVIIQIDYLSGRTVLVRIDSYLGVLSNTPECTPMPVFS